MAAPAENGRRNPRQEVSAAATGLAEGHAQPKPGGAFPPRSRSNCATDSMSFSAISWTSSLSKEAPRHAAMPAGVLPHTSVRPATWRENAAEDNLSAGRPLPGLATHWSCSSASHWSTLRSGVGRCFTAQNTFKAKTAYTRETTACCTSARSRCVTWFRGLNRASFKPPATARRFLAVNFSASGVLCSGRPFPHHSAGRSCVPRHLPWLSISCMHASDTAAAGAISLRIHVYKLSGDRQVSCHASSISSHHLRPLCCGRLHSPRPARQGCALRPAVPDAGACHTLWPRGSPQHGDTQPPSLNFL